MKPVKFEDLKVGHSYYDINNPETGTKMKLVEVSADGTITLALNAKNSHICVMKEV